MSKFLNPLVVVLLSAIGAHADVAGTNVLAEEFKSNHDKVSLLESTIQKWAAVNAWLIEYDAVPSPATDSYTALHRVMAVAGPDKLYHFGAHVKKNTSWQLDTTGQEFFVENGKFCHNWPFNRVYSEGSIKVGENLPGAIHNEIVLSFVPWWPITSYSMPTNHDTQVAVTPLDAARSPDYHILVRQEIIGGEPCAILDRGGYDRLWLAPKKGYCVMRREWHDPHSLRIIQRINTESVKEIEPGLWLPVELKNEVFSTDRLADNPAIERQLEIRLSRCEIDAKVPASTFSVQHPPGSLRYVGYQFTQVSDGGEDLFTNISNLLLTSGQTAEAGMPGSYYLFLTVGLIMGFCVGGFAVRMKRSEGKNERDSRQNLPREVLHN